MDGLMEKRAAVFADPVEWRELRALGASIRARALAKLPELLEQLEANCERNGIRVHWARTTEEANGIVLEILRERGATRLVKGKSMVSEEMHMNAFLEAHGVESLESDLGEYIIQLDHETPAHIIAPAIHKNRRQVARLFGEKIRSAKYTEDIDELAGIARRVLRRKFLEADAGISGVNFAVAETGTLCLVENEGNGRMSTHVPPVHVALMSIEKVVENLEDVPPLYSLLTRSATGQAITTYFNMISGPRGPDEKDGPLEVHLVILDNGRTRIAEDDELGQTLKCIRCGACMNHCPVYTRVGGHAYEAVYPGPIGKILVPQLEGEGVARRHEAVEASSLCGACGEVCPVGIPIPELIVRLRREAVRGGAGSSVPEAGEARSRMEDAAWSVWEAAHESPRAYRALGWLATRLGPPPAWLPILSRWTRSRTRPRPGERTLHELARDAGVPDE
jgi:L-lactate dehydrogenase complex protein LldF